MNRLRNNGLLGSLLMISLVLGAVAFADVDSDKRMQGDPKSGSSSASVTSAGEQIKWQVISGGGSKGVSAGYILNGTVGQTATGQGTAATHYLDHGFWQDFGATSCCDKPGDANNDGAVNVGDAVYVINFVFKGGPPPPCKCEGDANGDNAINVGDAVYVINFVFKGGPAPICKLTNSICQ